MRQIRLAPVNPSVALKIAASPEQQDCYDWNRQSNHPAQQRVFDFAISFLNSDGHRRRSLEGLVKSLQTLVKQVHQLWGCIFCANGSDAEPTITDNRN